MEKTGKRQEKSTEGEREVKGMETKQKMQGEAARS